MIQCRSTKTSDNQTPFERYLKSNKIGIKALSRIIGVSEPFAKKIVNEPTKYLTFNNCIMIAGFIDHPLLEVMIHVMSLPGHWYDKQKDRTLAILDAILNAKTAYNNDSHEQIRPKINRQSWQTNVIGSVRQ